MLKKRVIPIICLLVVAAAVILVLSITPPRDSASPGEYDGYTINPDGLSGIIKGTLPGYDLGMVNELRSKPYFGGVKIIYYHELTQVYGGMLEIHIAESADLIAAIEDLKTLLADRSAAFKVVKYSYSQLKQIEQEIEAAAEKARSFGASQSENPYSPSETEALSGIINCASSEGDNTVTVYIYANEYTQEKVGVLAELFPYDCLVFDVPALAGY